MAFRAFSGAVLGVHMIVLAITPGLQTMRTFGWVHAFYCKGERSSELAIQCFAVHVCFQIKQHKYCA